MATPHASEIERNQAERDHLLAQARKEKALAEKEEAQAEVAKLVRDREVEKRKRELASDERHHIYRFADAVSASTVTKCIAQLDFWARTDPKCDLEIEFYSPGGNVLAGMQLFDRILALRAAGHHVTTSTYGYAASMAGILLQAGDKRVIGRESYLLIHEISAMAGGKLPEIEDEIEFMKKIEKRVLRIFASRSKLTERQIQTRAKRKDWWLDSDECLKYGLVDEVR